MARKQIDPSIAILADLPDTKDLVTIRDRTGKMIGAQESAALRSLARKIARRKEWTGAEASLTDKAIRVHCKGCTVTIPLVYMDCVRSIVLPVRA